MFIEGLLLVGIGMILAHLVDNREPLLNRVFPKAAPWAGWLYGIRIAAIAQMAVGLLLGLGWLIVLINALAFLATFLYIDVEGIGQTEQQVLSFYKRKVISALFVYAGAFIILVL